MNAATVPATPPATGLKTKFTPVTRNFLRSQIDPKLGWFLMILEDLAMDRTSGFDDTWGIVSNADLRPTFGSDDTIGRLWAHAEDEDQPGGPYLKRIRTPKGARIGFIWLRRPTDRPVATPATFAQARAELEAAVAGRRGRARTIPIPAEGPCTYRRSAGAPTADLRVHLPQICVGSERAPLKERTRVLDPENTEKTTTTRAESSSFLTPSHQIQDPERRDRAEPPRPVAAEAVPVTTSTHVEVEAPPPVPELPAELAVHQALLIAIIARFAAFFGKPLDQARPILIGLWGEFRAEAKARGFTFDVRWLGAALDETEKAKAGRKIKGSPWVYFRGILAKYARQGGPMRDSPTEHQARATLEELASRGWTIVLKADGTAARGKIGGDACVWEDLPESLRRRVKEQEGPIRDLLKARETASRSWNPRC